MQKEDAEPDPNGPMQYVQTFGDRRQSIPGEKRRDEQ